MLKSMTAFARQACSVETGTLTWEIRSVNHRYLEPTFRLPENFRELEPGLRESLRKRLARGKVECSLKWQAESSGSGSLKTHGDTLKALNDALSDVRQHVEHLALADPIAVLQWPGVIDNEPADREALLKAVTSTFDSALDTLIEHRLREGAQIDPMLSQRLDAIEAIVASVREQLPGILQRQSDLVRQRFEEARVELDKERLEQEMVLLAQKSDVAEELDRLEAHVNEVRAVLQRNEPVGRRLDFLMQELNREANTLSSKSIVTDTTKAAVELKVLIEQMREQVQNIE